MRKTMRLTGMLLGVITAWRVGSTAEAGSASWSADADGNWSEAGNWDLGVPGSTSELNSADVATFGGALTGNRAVTVDDNRNVGGITFGSTNGYAYTLSGGPLLLSNDGVVQNTLDCGDHTDGIGAEVVIQGSGGKGIFTASAVSPNCILSVGAVSGSAASGKTNTLMLAGENTGSNLVSGVVSDGVGGGKLALRKIGSGTWILSGANTFGGAVNVTTGVLVVAHSGALGVANSAVTVATNSTLGLQGGIAISNRLAILDGGGLGNRGSLANVSDTNLWTGNITVQGVTPRINANVGKLLIAGNVTVQNGTGNFTLGGFGDGEISGVISGTRTLFRSSTDTGTWYLTGTNTFSGLVTCANGAIAINNNKSLGSRTSVATAGLTLGGATTRGTLRSMANVVLTNFYGITLHGAGGILRTDEGTTLTVNGIIADRAASPYGPLGKSGPGTLVLNGVNTFSNMFEISEGNVVLGRANALGGLNGIQPKLKVDATLDLGGFSVTNPVLTGAGGIVTNGSLRVTQETSVGGSASVAALTLPSATLMGTLTADVETDGSSDLLNVSGTLLLSELTLNIVDSDKLIQEHVYTLAACTDGIVSGRFVSDNLPEGWWVDYSENKIRLRYFAGMIMRVK